jgi:hypothetical protein
VKQRRIGIKRLRSLRMALLWYVSVKNVLLRTALGFYFVGFTASVFAKNEIEGDLGRFFTVKFGYSASQPED